MCTFLMISRVLYDKGYSQYVEAAEYIKSIFPSARFLLMGYIDETYPNYVPEDIVNKDVLDGTIEYLGYHKDVVNIIRDSDCIVHPTYYNEGLSRVLMEALAMSKPIITTNIPGCKETVIDGVNGYLCEPKDTQSLINSIRKFIKLPKSLRIEMGKAGRQKAEKVFNVEDVINVYRSITDKYLN